MHVKRRRLRRYEIVVPRPVRYGVLAAFVLTGGNLLVWWLGTSAFPGLPPLISQENPALLMAANIAWVLALLLGLLKYYPLFRV